MDDTQRAPARVAVELRPPSDAFSAASDVAVSDANPIGPAFDNPIATALLVASVAAPFLKGLIAGLALAGTAAAVGDVLGASPL